jgi:four helix bundle protein
MDRKKVETFRDLVVWQKSHQLTVEVYNSTKKFSKKESTSLAEHMRQSVAPIPINIARGFKKRGKKNKIHYYQQAFMIVEEIRYYLILSQELGEYKEPEAALELCDDIERMLKRLIRSVATPREQNQ